MNTLHKLDMNNSNNTRLNILDLPNEILFIIFKKLSIIDVVYSVVDVTRRFHRLALDPFHIRRLDMTDNITVSSLCNQTSSIDTQVLTRIFQKILPRIHHQAHQLTVEEYSMKQVLLAGNYPQLYSLSLINFEERIFRQYLTRMIFNFVCYDFKKIINLVGLKLIIIFISFFS